MENHITNKSEIQYKYLKRLNKRQDYKKGIKMELFCEFLFHLHVDNVGGGSNYWI